MLTGKLYERTANSCVVNLSPSSLQGVKPNSFDKIEHSEIKDIIEQCIRLARGERPSIKILLNHEFFAEEEAGLKLEVISKDDNVIYNRKVLIVQATASKSQVCLSEIWRNFVNITDRISATNFGLEEKKCQVQRK